MTGVQTCALPICFPVTIGGGRPIVNLSTAGGIVAAAAGLPVAKHGNRGITRPSGSADALTILGVAGARDAGECHGLLVAVIWRMAKGNRIEKGGWETRIAM